MANDDAILKAIESLRKDMATKSDLQDVKKDLQDVKATQQDHTKRLANLQVDVTTLKDGQAHTNTAIEVLDSKLDAAKTELRREIKERQKPQHAD